MNATNWMALRSFLIFCVLAPAALQAHGSPARWSAESTEIGCWVSRWLARRPAAGSEEMVGLQVVVGKIVPPRSNMVQPMITQAELNGATTINVRIVDPSIKGTSSVRILRSDGDATELELRKVDGDLPEFLSFYVTGPAADSALASMRASNVSAIIAKQPDGTEVSFKNSQTGLHTSFAMYDACVAAKTTK